MSSVLERSRFVLVIGGGQAGLAAGYWLKRQDIPFLIVEGSARIGDVWRQRYASLSLFTTRAFSALPGMALAGKAQGMPAAMSSRITWRPTHGASRCPSGCRPRSSACAPGRMGASWPTCRTAARCRHACHRGDGRLSGAGGAGDRARLRRSDSAVDPGELRRRRLPDGPVLVVGDGASGRDLAVQASASHPVMLATGKPQAGARACWANRSGGGCAAWG